MLKTYALGLMLILALTGLAQTPQSRTPAPRSNWNQYTPGNFGLSLELPGEPQPYDLDAPAEGAKEIQDFKTYIYTGPKWVILINHIHTADPASLQSFANGVVKGITSAEGVTNVEYSLEPKTATSVPISGSYKLNGNPLFFSGFAKLSGNDIYLVAAVWPMNDDEAEADTQRVLDSVQFRSR